MENRIELKGAPTNGGQYINGGLNHERSENPMFFNILGKDLVSVDKDFLARGIQRHFEAWKCLSNASVCRVLWVGDDLILATDSPELAEEWSPVEREYVSYMLGNGISNGQETFDKVDLDETDKVSEEWPFLPAA
jgi:hypothetical protein